MEKLASYSKQQKQVSNSRTSNFQSLLIFYCAMLLPWHLVCLCLCPSVCPSVCNVLSGDNLGLIV